MRSRAAWGPPARPDRPLLPSFSPLNRASAAQNRPERINIASNYLLARFYPELSVGIRRRGRFWCESRSCHFQATATFSLSFSLSFFLSFLSEESFESERGNERTFFSLFFFLFSRPPSLLFALPVPPPDPPCY